VSIVIRMLGIIGVQIFTNIMYSAAMNVLQTMRGTIKRDTMLSDPDDPAVAPDHDDENITHLTKKRIESTDHRSYEELLFYYVYKDYESDYDLFLIDWKVYEDE